MYSSSGSQAAAARPAWNGLSGPRVTAFVDQASPVAMQRAQVGPMYPDAQADVSSFGGPLAHFEPIYPDARTHVASPDGPLAHFGLGLLSRC